MKEKYNMIKNIIFDLGNVIFKWDPDIVLQHFAQNEEEAKLLKEYIFASEEWKLLDRGFINNDEAIEIIQNRLPDQYSNLIKTILHEWYKFQPINEDTVKVAKGLKEKGYKIYVLSNLAIETYEYFKVIDFFKLCDGVVISAHEKIVKPNKEIFVTLLERYNIKAKECLFIDDDDTNKSIHTANNIGILGRKVIPNSSGDVLKLLKEFGIEL